MDKWLETKQLPVHLVSAAGIVYRDGKVLLIRSERRGWEFPGGLVEQGEAILDGLRREILEESGIVADPEAVTGVYQNLEMKNGYGPLEGMTLPTTVNLVFRCSYISGTKCVSEECLKIGWFTPEEAVQMIQHPYLKQAFEDAIRCDSSPHFGTFRKNDSRTEFVSDCLLGRREDWDIHLAEKINLQKGCLK